MNTWILIKGQINIHFFFSTKCWIVFIFYIFSKQCSVWQEQSSVCFIEINCNPVRSTLWLNEIKMEMMIHGFLCDTADSTYLICTPCNGLGAGKVSFCFVIMRIRYQGLFWIFRDSLFTFSVRFPVGSTLRPLSFRLPTQIQTFYSY